MNRDKRKSTETTEQYHRRLKAQKRVEKRQAKGVLVWDSGNQGTYIKVKHGPLSEERS